MLNETFMKKSDNSWIHFALAGGDELKARDVKELGRVLTVREVVIT